MHPISKNRYLKTITYIHLMSKLIMTKRVIVEDIYTVNASTQKKIIIKKEFKPTFLA